MYPELPESPADLVPLPLCDGPKLKPFDFQGPQKIEFLGILGDGGHASVLKVKILGQIYALKLFRFHGQEYWAELPWNAKRKTPKFLINFYNYAEHFNRECRAYGRLQETGHEHLAVKSFGYVLLDEEHERAMMEQYPLDFAESIYSKYRERFLRRNGRLPPVRGIVKELGPETPFLETRAMRKLLQSIIRMHQLGIIGLDIKRSQLIGGKLCDFSTAITSPHFQMNIEMNHPNLELWQKQAITYTAFRECQWDYMGFDRMVSEQNWNAGWCSVQQRRPVSICALPKGFDLRRNFEARYTLRGNPYRKLDHTLVDPRLYDWRSSATSPGNCASGALDGRKSRLKTSGSSQGNPGGVVSKTRRHFKANPPKWYEGKVVQCRWTLKDGLFFPVEEV